MRKLGVLLALVVASSLVSGGRAAAEGQRTSGVSARCGTFNIDINLLFGTISIERPDEGWAWVDTSRKIRQVTGVAHNVHVAATDTPANHDSHDVDFEIRLDPGQEDLLSTQQEEALGIEWESGITPGEKTGDGANATFPKWAWPSEGDRAWVEGHWIFDCGHPNDDGLYHSEIHPPRAVAAMRDQAAPLPGTGVTPVPVTLTDLYITGRGGYAVQQLNCGLDIIIGSNGDNCGQSTPPADTSYKTTPINDTNFSFDVCLPPRPGTAAFSHRVDAGPGNTVVIEPQVGLVAAGGACLGDSGFDQASMMRVTVPLKDTPTPPTAVYARHIYAGWILPPDPVLERRRVSVKSTGLHEDHDLDPGDGELTFWWVNVNRAESAWRRLSDHANGNMNDYDDDFGPGGGEMDYTGLGFDFYLRHGQPFSVRSTGYEQDCFDNLGWFGDHSLSLLMYVACYSDFPDAGAGDPISKAEGTYDADDAGPKTIHTSDYDLRLTIDSVPLEFEDTSYLSINAVCAPAGEVALVGQPVTCTTRVDNAGPGLPRAVQVTTDLGVGTTPGVVSAATWSIRAPFGSGAHACAAGGWSATCHPDSVTVAAQTPVVVTTIATPGATGTMTERAEVTTTSSDPDLTNNVALASIEVFRSVTLDVSPLEAANVINLGRGGTLTVAIVTTPDFDAATVDAAAVCFGDAEAPGERTCTEAHGKAHLEDVNKDKRLDLVLHYDVGATGIDLGDTRACVKGRTLQGVGIYACDTISTVAK